MQHYVHAEDPCVCLVYARSRRIVDRKLIGIVPDNRRLMWFDVSEKNYRRILVALVVVSRADVDVKVGIGTFGTGTADPTEPCRKESTRTALDRGQ
jgi:hypothetical protein